MKKEEAEAIYNNAKNNSIGKEKNHPLKDLKEMLFYQLQQPL